MEHIQARFKRIDKLEARYTKRIRIALLRELEPLVAFIEAGASADVVATMVSTKTLKSVLEELYLVVIQQEAKHEYLHLVGEQKAAPTLPISDWLRRARNFVATESSKAIVAITNTTRNQVKKVLKESAVSGSSTPETAKNLRAQITQFSKARATTIARTELLGAMNYGSYCGAATSGLQLNKVWLATNDSRTRTRHAIANGQAVDINAPFLLGGEQCQYPADPALSARERIKCRCTTIYKRKPQPAQSSFEF